VPESRNGARGAAGAGRDLGDALACWCGIRVEPSARGGRGDGSGDDAPRKARVVVPGGKFDDTGCADPEVTCEIVGHRVVNDSTLDDEGLWRVTARRSPRALRVAAVVVRGSGSSAKRFGNRVSRRDARDRSAQPRSRRAAIRTSTSGEEPEIKGRRVSSLTSRRMMGN
jgi:hypothetical protein